MHRSLEVVIGSSPLKPAQLNTSILATTDGFEFLNGGKFTLTRLQSGRFLITNARWQSTNCHDKMSTVWIYTRTFAVRTLLDHLRKTRWRSMLCPRSLLPISLNVPASSLATCFYPLSVLLVLHYRVSSLLYIFSCPCMTV